MSTTGTTPATPAGSRQGARDRLLDAAERLFYADGIRAVGVDRLCAEAGVSKRSLYQHFDGKDDVVVAVLRARATSLGTELQGVGETPRERIVSVFARSDAMAGQPGYRGCPFVGAATELKDRDHPGSETARRAKTAFTRHLEGLAREAGADDAEALALQLTLLFDGASAHAVVHGGPTSATLQAVELLLTAHGVPGARPEPATG